MHTRPVADFGAGTCKLPAPWPSFGAHPRKKILLYAFEDVLRLLQCWDKAFYGPLSDAIEVAGGRFHTRWQAGRLPSDQQPYALLLCSAGSGCISSIFATQNSKTMCNCA